MLATRTAIPVTVPASQASPSVRLTALAPRGVGPYHRCAAARATSTASAKSGTSSAVSRSHEANGGSDRSIAPTAPRSVTTQKQSAAANSTASGTTLLQGTDGAAARVGVHGVMVQPNIMAWSSCARLWQWATYGPVKSRKPR